MNFLNKILKFLKLKDNVDHLVNLIEVVIDPKKDVTSEEVQQILSDALELIEMGVIIFPSLSPTKLSILLGASREVLKKLEETK